MKKHYEEGGEGFLQISIHNYHSLCKQNICCAGTSSKIQYGYIVWFKWLCKYLTTITFYIIIRLT